MTQLSSPAWPYLFLKRVFICLFIYLPLSHLTVPTLVSYSRYLTTKQLLQLVLLAWVWAFLSCMVCKGYIMLCCTELESECLKGVHWNKCLYCTLVMSICRTVLHFKKRKNNTEVTISYVHLKNCERNASEKGKCIIFQKEEEEKYFLNQRALVEVLHVCLRVFSTKYIFAFIFFSKVSKTNPTFLG